MDLEKVTSELKTHWVFYISYFVFIIILIVMIAKNSTLPANNLLNDAEYVAAATGDLVASILFAIVSIIAFIVAMGNKERSWVYAFSIVFALFLYYVMLLCLYYFLSFFKSTKYNSEPAKKIKE